MAFASQLIMIMGGLPMNSSKLNAMAGSILFGLLIVFGSRAIISQTSENPVLEKSAYKIAVLDESAKGEAPSTKKAPVEEKKQLPKTARLTTANPAQGKKIAKKCAACHSFNKGGKNGLGPNLYGIAGRQIASVQGFKYSPALKAKDGNWTDKTLDCFLTKPKDCIPGTKMVFAGLKKPNQRENLIGYLRSLSDGPLPTQKTPAQKPVVSKTTVDGSKAKVVAKLKKEQPTSKASPKAKPLKLKDGPKLAQKASARKKQPLKKENKLFNENCQVCHQADAIGKPGFAPSLTNPELLSIASDDFFITTIAQGREGTGMPPFSHLGKQNIEAIVKFLRGHEKLPNRAKEVNAMPDAHGDPRLGKQWYDNICSTCHGLDGNGYEAGGTGTAIGNENFLNTVSDGFLRVTIKEGRSNTRMLPFQGPAGMANLSETEIDDIIVYLRKLAQSE